MKVKQQKVINKGYTVTVVSWENDGDYYQTKTKIVDTLKEAEAYFKLIDFYGDNFNNQEPFENTEEEELIIEFMKDYENIFFSEIKIEGDEELLDKFNEIADSLIGNSECGNPRVVESCVVTYSPEDVYSSIIFQF